MLLFDGCSLLEVGVGFWQRVCANDRKLPKLKNQKPTYPLVYASPRFIATSGEYAADVSSEMSDALPLPGMQRSMRVSSKKSTTEIALRAGTFILAFIGIGAVIRRVLVIAGALPMSFSTSGGPAFDAGFTQHKVATLIHILPGAVFMVLGPLQFMPSLRHKHIRFHRRAGRVFLLASYIVGISALALPFLFTPIGGTLEATGTMIFGSYFLIALTNGWRYILKKNMERHRIWMIRAFAIGLAVATIRPVIGLFFALTDLAPRQFFGIAFWIGFTLHALIAELWIRRTRGVDVAYTSGATTSGKLTGSAK